MQESKLKSYLELTTNVAVLLAAIAVLTALSWGYFAQKQKPSIRSGLQKGRVIAYLPEATLNDSRATLLIAMSINCHFCTESISFYNQLARAQQGLGSSPRIIAVFPEEDSEVKQYVRQNRLEVSSTAATDFRKLGVDTTPTMILIDKEGKIIDFWIGKIPEDVQQQVVESIVGTKAKSTS